MLCPPKTCTTHRRRTPVLDGTAGCGASCRHCRSAIVDAIKRQLDTWTTARRSRWRIPASFRVADLIAQLAPGDLDHVFFANRAPRRWTPRSKSPSPTSVRRRRSSQRIDRPRARLSRRRIRRYFSRGIPPTKVYGSLLPRVDHLPHTHNAEKNAFSRGQPAWGAHLADDLETRIIALTMRRTSRR